MKKILQIVALTTLLGVNAYASEHEMAHQEESDFYLVAKGLVTLGDKVEHGEATLDGGVGKGVGIDFGYRLSHGFSVELDFTYAHSDVTEIAANHEKKEMTGKYLTSSFDVMYTYHALHHLGLFLKGGIEYEIETIDDLDIDASETGVIYAIGGEYELTHHTALIAEYEGSTIEGPRGNTLLAGLVYNF